MKNDIHQLIVSPSELNGVTDSDLFGGTPRLVLGFIPPGLDFARTASTLRKICNSSVLILSSTAGEICSRNGDSAVPLYLPDEDNRSSIVLQSFSENIIDKIDVFTTELHDPDMPARERTDRIRNEIERITPSFEIDHTRCIAYTLIDGISRSESFYMEALYETDKLPCLTIGGSAGGHLDFKNTYIYNNCEVVQNKAVVSLIRFREGIRLGVFKSQNFKLTPFSMTIAQANPAKRYVSSILDNTTGELKNIIDHLCCYFSCTENGLEEMLQNSSFAIKIHDDIYVRSISNIDFEHRRIHFYCDLHFGDELYLVQHTDFNQSIVSDYKKFRKDKNAEPLGGIFNDCILRRLINGSELSGVSCFDDLPVAGFSTFGELLGVNINQTLTALFLYRAEPGRRFYDCYIDNFTVMYSKFKEFFLLRKLNQQNQILKMNDRVWQSSRESINTMADFIEETRQNTRENDQIIELINSNFAKLYSLIDETRHGGRVITEELIRLGKSANNVENILYDIVDIAGQTSILGFNASIEAARTGQSHGGFSVIAKEIKNLANKTEGQVKVSKEVVADVISRMNTLKYQVEGINTNQTHVYQLSDDINQSFSHLTDSSKNVETQMSSHTQKIKLLINNIDSLLKTVNSLE